MAMDPTMAGARTTSSWAARLKAAAITGSHHKSPLEAPTKSALGVCFQRFPSINMLQHLPLGSAWRLVNYPASRPTLAGLTALIWALCNNCSSRTGAHAAPLLWRGKRGQWPAALPIKGTAKQANCPRSLTCGLISPERRSIHRRGVPGWTGVANPTRSEGRGNP